MRRNCSRCGLVPYNSTLAGLAFLALLALAAVAWIPHLGPAILGRVGWTRLPLVGGLGGRAASAAMAVVSVVDGDTVRVEIGGRKRSKTLTGPSGPAPPLRLRAPAARIGDVRR